MPAAMREYGENIALCRRVARDSIVDTEPRGQATCLLSGARRGDGQALSSLMQLVYDELRSLAGVYLRRERGGHTLQATALVNEAFLRMIDSTLVEQADQTHFFAIAAGVMRRVLIDHARGHGAQKRGGGLHRLTLDSDLAVTPDADVELLALEEALNKLAALDARQARVVELRFFGGLNVAEAADVLGVSKRSVENDWELARAWLHRQLSKAG